MDRNQRVKRIKYVESRIHGVAAKGNGYGLRGFDDRVCNECYSLPGKTQAHFYGSLRSCLIAGRVVHIEV